MLRYAIAFGARYQPQPVIPPAKSPFETRLPVVGSAAGARGTNPNIPTNRTIQTNVNTGDTLLVFLMQASFKKIHSLTGYVVKTLHVTANAIIASNRWKQNKEMRRIATSSFLLIIRSSFSN
jgi:hypothetical protein